MSCQKPLPFAFFPEIHNYVSVFRLSIKFVARLIILNICAITKNILCIWNNRINGGSLAFLRLRDSYLTHFEKLWLGKMIKQYAAYV